MAVLWSGTCLEVSGNGCGMFLELIVDRLWPWYGL